MGHGSRHENNAVYARLQDIWNRMGCKDVFLGTVEASPDLEEVIKQLRESGYRKVVLTPLMLVAGDHAHTDMAGDGPDSWKSRLEEQASRCGAWSGEWVSTRKYAAFISGIYRSWKKKYGGAVRCQRWPG